MEVQRIVSISYKHLLYARCELVHDQLYPNAHDRCVPTHGTDVCHAKQTYTDHIYSLDNGDVRYLEAVAKFLDPQLWRR
jgi:hypothetical protein